MTDVKLKRKITLKRKGENESSEPSKKTQKWLWIPLIVLVAGGIGFFVKQNLSSCDPTAVVSAGSAVEQSAETSVGITPAVSSSVADETRSTKAASEEPVASEAVLPVATPVAEPTVPSNQDVAPKSKPTESAASVSGSLEEKVRKTIRGDFGNGIDRKRILGSEYDAIQQRVNQTYRDGNVD